MDHVNPFALVRASDYTDEQINALWVEMGPSVINEIIEPTSRISKYILGGKGTGKTHLVRYYSYPAVRLRNDQASGVTILLKQRFLAVFLRATSLDAARFEASSEVKSKWQQLFGVYLELRLVEAVVDSLCDIKESSIDDNFYDDEFISEVAISLVDQSILICKTIAEFRKWVIQLRRKIDDAVNNSAFTGELDLRLPFSVGSFALPVQRAIGKWNSKLADLPLIYLIDEIENFSESQQAVVNSLIRYGGGLVTFRVTGRLNARKTFSTLSDGEENREGSEFKTTKLDEILRNFPNYAKFSKKFVVRRIESVGLLKRSPKTGPGEFDPHNCFEEISANDFYAQAILTLELDTSRIDLLNTFVSTLAPRAEDSDPLRKEAIKVAATLTDDFPLLLQKLNILIFCKKFDPQQSKITLANRIRADCGKFLEPGRKKNSSYARAYQHYAYDLFAQLCRQSQRQVPYAGFDTFVKMSSGNPRNLLIVLGHAYTVATFRGVDFINGPKLSVAMQTEAALEAARFMYESDTNFGSLSEQPRNAVARLADIFRAARYALNIPEVSPLAVSFAEEDLTPRAKQTLSGALNYSFVFEILDGRPDRNTQRRNRKIQLNPLLSPRWGLPTNVRGDISLGRGLVNAVFDPEQRDTFELLLKSLRNKWNNPFKGDYVEVLQDDLFS